MIVSAARTSVMTRGGTAVAVPPRTIAVSSFAPALVIRGEVQPAGRARTPHQDLGIQHQPALLDHRHVPVHRGTAAGPEEARRGVARTARTTNCTVPRSAWRGVTTRRRKLLNKALDERHRVAINQFAKATTEDAVRSLWREAVRRGEIPGAYWATLTHPATTQAIIRDAFGEVHMLSHLVGAANRADIRRLCQLEADNADLRARIDRQQLALRDAVVTRDAAFRNCAMRSRSGSPPNRPPLVRPPPARLSPVRPPPARLSPVRPRRRGQCRATPIGG